MWAGTNIIQWTGTTECGLKWSPLCNYFSGRSAVPWRVSQHMVANNRPISGQLSACVFVALVVGLQVANSSWQTIYCFREKRDYAINTAPNTEYCDMNTMLELLLHFAIRYLFPLKLVLQLLPGDVFKFFERNRQLLTVWIFPGSFPFPTSLVEQMGLSIWKKAETTN